MTHNSPPSLRGAQATKQSRLPPPRQSGLLRFARNDGGGRGGTVANKGFVIPGRDAVASPESRRPIEVMNSGPALGGTSRNDERQWSSPPQPVRRALLRKCLRSLDIVLRMDHRLHRRVVALLGDRLLQRHREA